MSTTRGNCLNGPNTATCFTDFFFAPSEHGEAKYLGVYPLERSIHSNLAS